MIVLSFAYAPLILALGSAVGLALLIVLFLRQNKTIAALSEDLGRMHKVQRDGSADVRKRLDDNASTLIALQGALEPLKASAEQAEPVAEALTKLEGGIAALGTKIGAFEDRLGRIEETGHSAAAGVSSVRDDWSRIQSMIENTERNLASFEAGRTQEARRIEELREVVTSLRGRVDDRIEVQEKRLLSLERFAPGKGETTEPTGASTESPEVTEEGPDTPPEPATPVAALDKTPPAAPPPPAPSSTPATREAEAASDEAGANWIFLVLAVLLALALVAQYVRS